MGKASRRKKENASQDQPLGSVLPSMHREDRALLDAHYAMLGEAIKFLREPAARATTPGKIVVVGLASRVIQLAHGLQALCEAGHAGEGAPIARAILSGTASLVAICERDVEGRAFAYVRGGRLSDRRIRGAASELGIEGEEFDRFVRDLRAASTRGERQFVEQRTHMQRLGNKRADTWHGLSDESLFSEMKMSAWYELFYRTFSDEAHVGARAITGELRELLSGDIAFGSKFGACWEVVVPSGRCVAEVLAQLNIAFDLGDRDHVLAISKPFEDAMATYHRFDQVV